MTPVIFGVGGHRLAPKEAEFFRKTDPWAFILFARNVGTPTQLKALCDDLRQTVGRNCLIFVDQEGGRVQRLRAPNWPTYPSGAAYAELYRRDRAKGRRATYLGFRLIAHDLRTVGITANCAPVLDLPQDDADPIISDRAYGTVPPDAEDLAHAVMAGLMSGGVAPVIKHIPGHGRATVDSHLELPLISAGANAMQSDFAPFRAFNDAPMAMTAHAVYDVVDAELPITLSKTGIDSLIRGDIGFDGLLMTDDLDMKALDGSLTALARKVLAAGCDVVLQCNGELAQMRKVARGLSEFTTAGLRRARAATACAQTPLEFDVECARAEFDALMAARV